MTKKVFILGTDHYDLFNVPWEEDAEYWALNNAYNDDALEMDKITAWFDLHTDERRRRRFQSKQMEWLQEEHDFPIYMQKIYTKWSGTTDAGRQKHPSAIEFPIEKITKKLMGNKLQWDNKALDAWFGCSHAFMTAFAIYKGFKEIEYYGVHLSNPVEVYMERPSFFYWVGQANARKIKTNFSARSQLLWEQTYAYDEREGELWMPKSVQIAIQSVETFGDLIGVSPDGFEKLREAYYD